uniref:Chromosome partition protein Smc n=1 Tax=Schlesneria paludicola TaxID=360056 RepID=A0A7C4QRG4_9PLAN
MFVSWPRWWMLGGIATLVVSSLGLANSWSYLKTAWRGVGETIRDATPIDFDLQRLDGMIRELEPEIRRNQEVVAQLEVEVEYLQREVAALKEEQETAKAQMRRLRDALGDGQTQLQFAGQSYSRQDVERDLQKRLDQYEQRQSQLGAKEQLLEQRRRTLEAAEAKVLAYREQYEQLVDKSEQLQAELKLAEAAQAAGRLEFDSSKLAQTRQLAQDVEKRIRVLQRVVDSQRKSSGEIPVEADKPPATKRFDELFGPTAPAAAQPNPRA